MSNYFFVLVIVVVAVVLFVIWYLVRLLMKEFALYKLFSNNDWTREQLARDPRRFHTSIIYLMAYMMRTDNKDVQYDKLSVIARYIKEVCPESCQEDCIDALDFMTRRVKGSGKQRKYYSIVQKNILLQENSSFLSDEGGDYVNTLHGRRLAEEVAHYLDESDRRYLMYLLFQLAIADGVVTLRNKGSHRSELSMLKKLCIRGMHVPEAEFTEMFEEWKAGNIDAWYEKNIAPYNHGMYADKDRLANVFHSTCSFAQIEKDLPNTSVYGSIKSWLSRIVCVLSVFIFIVFHFDSDLMVDRYPGWLFLTFFVFTVLTFIVLSYLSPLNSSVLPILRTKYESILQRNRLIISSVLILGTAISLYFNAMNALYLLANQTYVCNVANRTSRITGTYTTTTRSKNRTKTYYHISFDRISAEDVRDSHLRKPNMSLPNKLCVEALPILSGAKYFGHEKKYKTMSSIETSSSKYYEAQTGDYDIELMFKVGCYGLTYYSSFELVPSATKHEFYSPKRGEFEYDDFENRVN